MNAPTASKRPNMGGYDGSNWKIDKAALKQGFIIFAGVVSLLLVISMFACLLITFLLLILVFFL